MKENIFIPETVDMENLDLFDGFILSMHDDTYKSIDFDLHKLDKDSLSTLYTRLMHYADISRNGYTEESKKLGEKMRKHIDTQWFEYQAQKCMDLMQK